jgi:hypothetical protein
MPKTLRTLLYQTDPLSDEDVNDLMRESAAITVRTDAFVANELSSANMRMNMELLRSIEKLRTTMERLDKSSTKLMHTTNTLSVIGIIVAIAAFAIGILQVGIAVKWIG